MALVSTLQNALLQILREKLIPWTRDDGGAPILSGQPPLVVPSVARVQCLPMAALYETGAERYGGQGVYHRRWPAQRFHTARFTCLGCILEGEADLQVATTQSMAAMQTMVGPGAPSDGHGSRYILMLPRGTFFLIPAGVPHNDGTLPHWSRPHPEAAHSRILWIYILPSGAVCHTCATSGTEHFPQPSLFVRDTELANLISLLIAELETHLSDYDRVAQALLKGFFLRLHRNLAAGRPLVADRELRTFPSEVATGTDNLPPRTVVLKRACAYIRGHLDEALSPTLIARHAYVSTSHLNRIFDAELGQSVMRYVTQCRIETAKSLLEGTDLAVAEISQLVGYKFLSHFSQSFRQATQMSPVAFRKLQASLQDRP